MIEGPVTLPPVIRVAVMPGDPRECRERALRCAQLAVTARTQQLKDALQRTALEAALHRSKFMISAMMAE